MQRDALTRMGGRGLTLPAAGEARGPFWGGGDLGTVRVPPSPGRGASPPIYGVSAFGGVRWGARSAGLRASVNLTEPRPSRP